MSCSELGQLFFFTKIFSGLHSFKFAICGLGKNPERNSKSHPEFRKGQKNYHHK